MRPSFLNSFRKLRFDNFCRSRDTDETNVNCCLCSSWIVYCNFYDISHSLNMALHIEYQTSINPAKSILYWFSFLIGMTWVIYLSSLAAGEFSVCQKTSSFDATKAAKIYASNNLIWLKLVKSFLVLSVVNLPFSAATRIMASFTSSIILMKVRMTIDVAFIFIRISPVLIY